MMRLGLRDGISAAAGAVGAWLLHVSGCDQYTHYQAILAELYRKEESLFQSRADLTKMRGQFRTLRKAANTADGLISAGRVADAQAQLRVALIASREG